MLEVGGDLDLPHKALGAERLGQLLVQDLEGDWAIVPEIARQVDRSHAAPAELALEQVTIAEGIRQRRVDCGHGDAVCGKLKICLGCRERAMTEAMDPCLRASGSLAPPHLGAWRDGFVSRGKSATSGHSEGEWPPVDVAMWR
jgi:hypothetical protein